MNSSFSVFSKEFSGYLLCIKNPPVFAFSNQNTQGKGCVYCFETQIFAYVTIKQ